MSAHLKAMGSMQEQQTGSLLQISSFLAAIAATSLRPDMVLWSQGTVQTVLLELTVLCEEGCMRFTKRRGRDFITALVKASFGVSAKVTSADISGAA
ncbi:Hypothetical predicted protein [Mytilus galloprovincialis]|uniref:Uncharacterized protein n=1 Tax=Mytilus galloprovincialis TaxID=29158 RepID=A0A8B6E8L0_MYTGA|nr:Hypothetical predicted protein [Mytilus galloprovincialis]